MNRSILFSCLFFLCTNIFAQRSVIENRIVLLNTAFATHTDSLLTPILAKDFSVATYMGKDATFCLNHILQSSKIDSLVCTKVSKQNQLLIADVKIIGGNDSETKIYFNEQQQILRADFLDKFYNMNRNIKAEKVATIPFENENGSIIITATLNNKKRPLRLLFDTGSDGMMLSESLADSIGLDVSHKQQASVVGGNVNMAISQNNDVHMNGFVFDKQNIAVFGTTHPGHDGILGNTLVKRYIVEVDYNKKEIYLYKFGAFTAPSGANIIPVDVSSGNMAMQARLSVTADKPVDANFIFDTGAGYELIVFRPLVKQNRLLVDGFQSEAQGTTVSMGVTTPVFTGKAASLTLMPSLTVKNFNVTLMGASKANTNWQPEYDGSLGIKFISQYNFTINLMDKYIAFAPNGK